MDKRLGKKTGLSKAGLISSITMGAVLGTIVWYFLLKCEEPSCPINYVHLIFCLLIFSFFGWATGEIFIPPASSRKKRIKR
jgi:hypothetical protein